MPDQWQSTQDLAPPQGAASVPQWASLMARAIAKEEGAEDPRSLAAKNYNPGDLRSPGLLYGPGGDVVRGSDGMPKWDGSKLPGQTGIDQSGFAIFDKPETGWSALENHIQKIAVLGGGLNFREFFGGKPGIYKGYAPAGDPGNNPESYAQKVAGAHGVTPDTKVIDAISKTPPLTPSSNLSMGEAPSVAASSEWQSTSDLAPTLEPKPGATSTSKDPGFLSGLYESTVGAVAPLLRLTPLGVAYDAIQDLRNGRTAGTTTGETAVGVLTGLQKGLITDPAKAAVATFQAGMRGDPMGVIRHAPGIIPLVGPAVDEATNRIEQGQTGRGVGNLLGIVGSAAAPAIVDAVVPAVSRATTTAAVETAGKTTGVGATALRRAIENPSDDLVNAMRGGVTDTEMVGKFRDALQNVKDARSAEYQAKLAALPSGPPLDITPIRASLGKKLADFHVKITPEGELDFSRSTIRDAAAQSEIKGIYEDVRGWGTQPNDLTPIGVDTLKRRIADTYSPNSNARAIVQDVKSSASDLLNSNVAGYQDMTAGYAESSKFLDELKDLSLESKNPGTAVRKLTTLLNQNNGYRQMLAERLSQYTPDDLEGILAGQALSKWAPRGIAGAGSGVGLIYGVVTHALSPYAAVGVAMSSPRLMGELLTAIGKLPKIPSTPAGLGQAIGTGTALAGANAVESEPISVPLTAAQVGQANFDAAKAAREKAR